MVRVLDGGCHVQTDARGYSQVECITVWYSLWRLSNDPWTRQPFLLPGGSTAQASSRCDSTGTTSCALASQMGEVTRV